MAPVGHKPGLKLHIQLLVQNVILLVPPQQMHVEQALPFPSNYHDAPGKVKRCCKRCM